MPSAAKLYKTVSVRQCQMFVIDWAHHGSTWDFLQLKQYYLGQCFGSSKMQISPHSPVTYRANVRYVAMVMLLLIHCLSLH